MTDGEWQGSSIHLTVDLVILALRDAGLHVTPVQRGAEPYAGMMTLPGGFRRDEAEPILAAARRELAEETRLDAGALLAIMPRLPDPLAGPDAADARRMPAGDVLGARLGLASVTSASSLTERGVRAASSGTRR